MGRPIQSRPVRALHLQSLERRHLLAAEVMSTNPLQPLDVNADGLVAASDAVSVISSLIEGGAESSQADYLNNFVDVNNDSMTTVLDALQIINALNRRTPLVAATLPGGMHPEGDALRTKDYTINFILNGDWQGQLVGLRINGQEDSTFTHISDQFRGQDATLTMAEIDELYGRPLPPGRHQFELQIGSGDRIQFTLLVAGNQHPTFDAPPTFTTGSNIAAVVAGQNDDYNANEDAVLSIAAPGVLANDSEPQSNGTVFHVTPTGTPGGDGSVTNPWDLQTALDHPTSVQPGDTIWLHDGTYVGAFENNLVGTAAEPIIVQSAPGEWARLDMNDNDDSTFNTFAVRGAYTHFQGFEVFSSDPDSRRSLYGTSWAQDQDRGSVEVYGEEIKLVNLVLHDLNKGIGFWASAIGGEIYGNLIFNNGWWGTDRFHGPALYSQNTAGVTKRIADNIVFNQFYNGIYLTGTSNTELDNYLIEGNVSFNPGAAYGSTFNPAEAVLIGGGNVMDDVIFRENSVYVAGNLGFSRFGLNAGGNNFQITDNNIYTNVLLGSSWGQH